MNNEGWRELATSACEDAGIQQDSIEIITTWDQTFTNSENFRHNAVFRISHQRILKIFGTEADRNLNVERAVLQTLNNQIPASRLIASGTIEHGSPYIIMTEVTGTTLQRIWDDLSSLELHVIAREIGSITAQLHLQQQNKLAAVEAQFGGRNESIKDMKARCITDIKALHRLPTRHKDELLEFLHGEALRLLDVRPVFTHSDLSHAHIYIVKENSQPSVSGIIDWGGAMLGPPEWDIAFNWLWTFSQDQDTMHEFLYTYYQNETRPSQFARRCFATHLYTFSIHELWEYFNEPLDNSESIVRKMIMAMFPPDVFGSPE